jgi:hypothetical protein
MRPTIRLRALSAPPTAPPTALTAFRLRRSLAWPVGQAEARFPPGAAPLEAGAQVVAEGSMDGSSYDPLFTGTILRSRRGDWQTEVLAEEATGPLARLFVAQVIESGTASSAISDLCDAAGVTCTTDSPGPTLAAFPLLGNRTAAEQIIRLAELSGLMVRTDTSGQLLVGTAPMAPTGAMLRPQDPVLSFESEAQAQGDDGPGTFAGDGAVAAKGAGTEHWVAQSLDTLKAGDGLPLTLMPALHQATDLTQVAMAEQLRLGEIRQRRTLTLAALPPADLGEVILLQGFPEGNGPARVAAIDLEWGARTGLICRLELHGLGG